MKARLFSISLVAVVLLTGLLTPTSALASPASGTGLQSTAALYGKYPDLKITAAQVVITPTGPVLRLRIHNVGTAPVPPAPGGNTTTRVLFMRPVGAPLAVNVFPFTGTANMPPGAFLWITVRIPQGFHGGGAHYQAWADWFNTVAEGAGEANNFWPGGPC